MLPIPTDREGTTDASGKLILSSLCIVCNVLAVARLLLASVGLRRLARGEATSALLGALRIYRELRASY